MVRQSVILISLSFALSGLPVLAQAQSDEAHQHALQVLRQAMLEQQRTRGESMTNPPPPRVPAFEELEQQYLDGKITARQFQQYLLDFKLQRARPATNSAANAVTTPPPPPPLPEAQPVIVPASAATNLNNPNAAALNRIAEVEARMDQILREKAERDKARTNAAPATAEPKTKREKLDDLLRQLIAGKLTQEEYKARWSKIAAEPD